MCCLGWLAVSSIGYATNAYLSPSGDQLFTLSVLGPLVILKARRGPSDGPQQREVVRVSHRGGGSDPDRSAGHAETVRHLLRDPHGCSAFGDVQPDDGPWVLGMFGYR